MMEPRSNWTAPGAAWVPDTPDPDTGDPVAANFSDVISVETP